VRKTDLSEETFSQLWWSRHPLVVQGLQESLQLRWTPEFFVEQFGETKCEVEDCETGNVTVRTIAQFYALQALRFRRENVADQIISQDWPPQDRFREMFPQLQEEFERVVPMPAYTTPIGTMNLAAHFPENSVVPDLGPKLYIASGSTLDEDHSGSTRLHLDLSDAVNILTYASLTPEGLPGFALWHIFAPEDSVRIRAYLRQRVQGCNDAVGDPIHNQQTYLTPRMLRDLEEHYSVRPYTIRQYVGDAIFIPAGCAHQVSNQANCIKIACDFISPQSLAMCEKLSVEFREQRLAKHWPLDVIPFGPLLYYIWVCTSRISTTVAT
ncbi:hypothetical protein C8Q76DRAFT_627624, partial [Earliella scabrosa]